MKSQGGPHDGVRDLVRLGRETKLGEIHCFTNLGRMDPFISTLRVIY